MKGKDGDRQLENYEIMRIGFFVCLAVAGLFLVLTILLFFMFDIPGIISSRSGKTKAKTIQEMEETNSTTGRLLQKKHTSKTTGNLKKQKVTVKQGTVLTPNQINGSGITEEIQPDQKKENTDGSSETAILGADAAQTAPLGNDSSETAVLGADAAQTSVLGADAAQTSVLGADAAQTEVLDAVTQRYGDSETAVLVQSASVPAVEGVRFEITKNVILCDTQEIVE